MREQLKQREGDQVLPTGDESLVDDQALLIADIEKRRQVGIERYGQGHRPFNGRDTLLDAYEEQLDFLVYLRSIKRMAESTREELIAAVARALHPEPDGEDEATAQIAVDAIMGWVVGQNLQNEEAETERPEPLRPHWMPRDLEEVYLGITQGEWPIQAFAKQSQAAYWASNRREGRSRERYVIGPIQIPRGVPAYKGHKVPEQYGLEEVRHG